MLVAKQESVCEVIILNVVYPGKYVFGIWGWWGNYQWHTAVAFYVIHTEAFPMYMYLTIMLHSYMYNSAQQIFPNSSFRKLNFRIHILPRRKMKAVNKFLCTLWHCENPLTIYIVIIAHGSKFKNDTYVVYQLDPTLHYFTHTVYDLVTPKGGSVIFKTWSSSNFEMVIYL